MSRKLRFRRIGFLFALGAILGMICFQVYYHNQDMHLKSSPASPEQKFLNQDTRNASPEKNKTEDVIVPEPRKEINVKQIRPMMATAYDLSINCCGKSYSHPSRGITSSGRNLSGLSREKAMAVSSAEFPLGTKLLIEFPVPYEHFNGIYTVEDTGNLRSDTVDLYMGDFGERVGQETRDFGVRHINVKVL
jgi:3D (Asp-Asp-Asp) domain-containing protein